MGRSIIFKLVYTILPKRQLVGFNVAVNCDKRDRDFAFSRVEQALSLIQQYDQKTFRYVKRNVEKILVCGDPSAGGSWHESLRMVEINSDYVCSDRVAVEYIASIIVHERHTHGCSALVLDTMNQSACELSASVCVPRLHLQSDCRILRVWLKLTNVL